MPGQTGESDARSLREALEALAEGREHATSAGAAEAFVRAILAGPEPGEAATRALGLPKFFDGPPPHPCVAQLLHEGTYPARMMALDPEALRWLGRRAHPLERETIRERIDALCAHGGIEEAVARVRNAVYLELAQREVAGRPIEDVGPALSALVGACVDAAMDATAPSLREEVVVFAMGKLAGDELNYLSDVDFIFVHADDAGDDADPGRAHGRRVRLHGQLRSVLRILEGPAKWRPVFRVDLRLRPFGSRGPLSMSVSATERYYEAHGRDWERQVWLRSTPLCGRLDLGHKLLNRLAPFVYRRTLGPEIFDEVEAVMRRARREARRNRLSAEGVDLKLDRGGIREVEFFVQALQLIHAGRRPELRSPSTLLALDRLAAAGLLSDHDHQVLADGYRWLRRVEHRVQLGDGQQTHRVPEDAAALERLAARLASSGDLIAPESDQLRGRLHAIRASVCQVTALFGDDERPASSREERRRWALEVILDDSSPPALRVEALSLLDLRDPEEAAALIAHLYSRPSSAWRERGPARDGATRLLLACLDSADPDAALRRMAEFSAHRPAHFGLWRYFADPKHEALVRRVADLFGASEPLSRGLIGSPARPETDEEGALALLFAARDGHLPNAQELEDAWSKAERDARSTREPLTPDQLRRELLHFKNQQLVRIGAYDLARRADPLEVGRALSDLADQIVQRLATAAAEAASEGTGGDAEAGLTLLAFAMGKYGMQAMDYASDLDLFFVFEASAGLGVERATRLARRFLSLMQGSSARDRLYEVDMRLRPSGGQGLLVTSLEGFTRYHASGLPVWERLALLRTRPVASMRIGAVAPAAGPIEAQVMEVVRRSCFASASAADFPEISRQVRELKARIERELSRETRTQRDVKTGRGGVLEFELLVGALQMAYGSANAPIDAPSEEAELRTRIRARDILHALSALDAAGKLEPGQGAQLAQAYRFMRRFLNRLRMQSSGGTAHSPDRFDINSPRLSALARRMGVASTSELVREYERHARGIREAFDRHLPA